MTWAPVVVKQVRVEVCGLISRKNFETTPLSCQGNTFCKYEDVLQLQIEVANEIIDLCARIVISFYDIFDESN